MGAGKGQRIHIGYMGFQVKNFLAKAIQFSGLRGLGYYWEFSNISNRTEDTYSRAVGTENTYIWREAVFIRVINAEVSTHKHTANTG